MRNSKTDYYVLLSYFAIAYSAIHFFVGYALAKTIFLLILLALTRMRFITGKSFFYLLISFGLIVFGQFITLEGFNLVDTFAVLVLTILIPYAIYSIIGLNFPRYYVKAMLIICIVSLPFYFGSLISSSFYHYIQSIPEKYSFLDPSEYNRQFILHSATVAKDSFSGLLRNAGPFNEAGVHALFLTIGYYFNFITSKKLFNFTGVIFLLSIIFTFSTAGYLGLFVLFIGLYSELKIHPVLKVVALILLIVFAINFFLSNELMYSKIQTEYNVASERDLNEFTGGRFFGARKAIVVLQNYPIFGRGLTHATRETDEFSAQFLRYGIMSEFGKIGIPFAILYLIMLYRGIISYQYNYKSKKFLSICFYIALLLNLFSQSFSLYPVLMIIIITGMNWNYIKPKQFDVDASII